MLKNNTIRAGKITPTLISLLLVGCVLFTGCGTTTKQVVIEQLLVSDAVDQAVQQIDFDALTGHKVYLDTRYIKPVKGVGFVNSEYVESALRQHLTASRCLIEEKIEEAEIIVEPRIGGMGADGHDLTFGIPRSNAITSAASAIGGTPLPIIPELSLGKTEVQIGAAKLAVFAYYRESQQALWQSGAVVGRSTARDMWFLGAGPFHSGTVWDRAKYPGQRLSYLPFSKKYEGKFSSVPYYAEADFPKIPMAPEVQIAKEEKPKEESAPATEKK